MLFKWKQCFLWFTQFVWKKVLNRINKLLDLSDECWSRLTKLYFLLLYYDGSMEFTSIKISMFLRLTKKSFRQVPSNLSLLIGKIFYFCKHKMWLKFEKKKNSKLGKTLGFLQNFPASNFIKNLMKIETFDFKGF